MKNNLRTKLATTNMVATTIVLVMAIIVIFFTGFTRIDTMRLDTMLRALDFDYEHRTQGEFAKNFNNVVLVVYDQNKVSTLYVGGSVKGAFVEDILAQVDKIAQDSATSNDTSFDFHYRKQVVDDNVVKIVFSDPANYQSGFIPLALYAIGVLIVGVLCHSVISTMLAQSAIAPIEESWKKQRQFVADASHELKTPLSVIMANTEIIASHPDDTVESQMKWVNNTMTEAKRMASLVADLLFLAKSDDGLKVEMQHTNLTDCVETCVLTHEAVFYENNKVFTNEIAPDVLVNGNEGQLKQLVTILLDNANKYSLGDGNIQLVLATSGKNAILTVSNDSIELASEQVTHLFDRFYTVDHSRNKSTGGNGLGLSIAERICQTHNGSITADYKNGKMTFKVVLPLDKNKKAPKVDLSSEKTE